MKVHEFSARLGIPASKIRYYDRYGVISGRRLEGNNYREYDTKDALDIYNALMFRSFDMSVSQAVGINGECRLKDVNDWLSRHIVEVERQIARTLAEHLPFSYVALKIPEDSLFGDQVYQVQAGLGILEENRVRCGLDLTEAAFEIAGAERLTIWLEKEDPFHLTRAELEPIFKEAALQGVELFGDAVGRMYLGYTMNGRRVHCFALGICFR